MAVEAFAVLAEPTRRRILDVLRGSERSVGDLVEVLSVTQPTMSKHLKVLREAGFVSCRTAAQQRIYRIETGPFRDIDAWLDPYRRMWQRHLDLLERHPDSRLDTTLDNRLDRRRSPPIAASTAPGTPP